MTIEKGSSDIWVDHCTFYKSYDGVIDVKTPVNDSNITISWCEFLPASEDNVFFDEMMNAMKANPDNYPYYKHNCISADLSYPLQANAYNMGSYLD